MIILQRTSRWVVLLALVLSGIITVAQDTSDINIQGSGVVLPVIEAIADLSDEVTVTTEVTGTDAGLAAFCGGELNIAAASRVMSVEEERACDENGVEFYELQIGFDIPAFITHPESEAGVCVTADEISTLLAPSAINNVQTWGDLQAETATGEETDEAVEDTADSNISFFLPLENTLNYLALDDIVDGVGFRSDATLASADEIVTSVAETPNSLGMVSLSNIPDDSEVRILEFSTGNNLECSYPSASAAEASAHPASARLLVYANAAAIDTLQPLLELLLTDEAVNTIVESGYTPATDDARALGQQIVAGELGTGREFSREVTAFEPPEVLFGEFTIAGSAVGYDIVDAIRSMMSSTQENLTVNLDLTSAVQGITAVCESEAALAVVQDGAEGAEEAYNICEENDIATVMVDIGQQPAVIVRNADDEFASCLTLEQVTSIWGASDEMPANWQDIDSNMPDLELILLAGRPSPYSYNDIMLHRPGQVTPPLRPDVEYNQDVLYRAAAVANVSGALTFMSYTEYERVLENEQEGIELVSVDAGDGCIAPEPDTFTDGSYPLQRSLSLVIAQDSLADVNVQSFLWTLFDDMNVQALRGAGIAAVDRRDLTLTRDRLEDEFEAASRIVSQRGLEESAPTEETPEAEEDSADEGQ